MLANARSTFSVESVAFRNSIVKVYDFTEGRLLPPVRNYPSLFSDSSLTRRSNRRDGHAETARPWPGT